MKEKKENIITCHNCKYLKYDKNTKEYSCSKGEIPNFVIDISKRTCMSFRTF